MLQGIPPRLRFALFGSRPCGFLRVLTIGFHLLVATHEVVHFGRRLWKLLFSARAQRPFLKNYRFKSSALTGNFCTVTPNFVPPDSFSPRENVPRRGG